jgi:hypothetical protein
MTSDNSLIIGVVLIGIALILAFLAYYILTSGRGEEEIEEDEGDTAEPDTVTPELEATEGELDEPPPSQEEEAVSVEVDLETSSPQAEVSPEPSVDADAPGQETTQDELEPEATQLELPKADRSMVPVATLLRDEVTGELIVRVGDCEYTTADELKTSEDWNRVEYAASDLTKWLTSTAPNERILRKEHEQIPQQPPSMIEQINEILKQQLAESPEENKAVRLIEGPGGAVRVFVGVHSYAIDEVPDPEVQRVIREAVAAWEENQ